MTTPHAHPVHSWDEHKLLVLRKDMAVLDVDYRRARKRRAFLVAFLPLFALVVGAEIIAGHHLLVLLTILVVLMPFGY